MIMIFLNYIPRIWIFVGLALAENLKNEYDTRQKFGTQILAKTVLFFPWLN